jgi:hypothetical protein
MTDVRSIAPSVSGEKYLSISTRMTSEFGGLSAYKLSQLNAIRLYVLVVLNLPLLDSVNG